MYVLLSTELECYITVKFDIKKKYYFNIICIPGSFNTSISHQLFDCKITFMN